MQVVPADGLDVGRLVGGAVAAGQEVPHHRRDGRRAVREVAQEEGGHVADLADVVVDPDGHRPLDPLVAVDDPQPQAWRRAAPARSPAPASGRVGPWPAERPDRRRPLESQAVDRPSRRPSPTRSRPVPRRRRRGSAARPGGCPGRSAPATTGAVFGRASTAEDVDAASRGCRRRLSRAAATAARTSAGASEPPRPSRPWADDIRLCRAAGGEPASRQDRSLRPRLARTPVGTYKLSVCVGSLGLACRQLPSEGPASRWVGCTWVTRRSNGTAEHPPQRTTAA